MALYILLESDEFVKKLYTVSQTDDFAKIFIGFIISKQRNGAETINVKKSSYLPLT